MKPSELSLVLKHGRVYSVANIVNRAAGLVLLPVYLHVLEPAEYGLLALVTVTTDLIGVVLGLGLGRAVLRLYVGAADDSTRDALLVTALALVAALGLGFALVAMPVAALTSRLMLGSAEHMALFAWANLSVVFAVLFNFQLSCLVARKASGIYFLAAVAKTGLMLGINVMLVVSLGLGVFGVILGTLISSAVLAAVLAAELLRGRRLRVSRTAARELVVFAAPLVPSVLLDTLVQTLDKIALSRLATPSAVGAYATGQRLSSLIMLFVVQPFMQIWAVRQLEAEDHLGAAERASLARVFDLFLVVLSASALTVALFAPEIVAIIADEAFAPAAAVVPTLALAEIVLLFRSYFEIGVFHANATRYLPWVSLATLIAALPAYAGCVAAFGARGAAYAYLATAVVRVALVAAVARRVSRFGRDLVPAHVALAVGGAFVAFVAAEAWVPATTTAMTCAARIGLVAAYLGLIGVSPVVGPDGRRLVTARLNARRRTPDQSL